jgi:hypothetical protein
MLGIREITFDVQSSYFDRVEEIGRARNALCSGSVWWLHFNERWRG